MTRAKASQARQQLLKTEEERAAHIQELLQTNEMIEGSFVILARKCGKPTCRCASGEKHHGKYLSKSEGGRTRMLYIPAGDEVEVATKAERYRRFRQARAELMKLAAKTAEIADDLQRALTLAYPLDRGSGQHPQHSKKASRTRKGPK